MYFNRYGLITGYLLFAATFIYEYDALSGPPDTGMDYFNCFYFSFISMTTIGLGDIMPNNVPVSLQFETKNSPIFETGNESKLKLNRNISFAMKSNLNNVLKTDVSRSAQCPLPVVLSLISCCLTACFDAPNLLRVMALILRLKTHENDHQH